MRNKIKQLMNKEEGFTLVELLAVIVILGIILAIAIPSIGGVIERAESDANDASISLAEDAARIYYTQRSDEAVEGDTILISELVSEGYLDLRDNDDFSGYIEYSETGDSPTFTYNTGTPSD